MADDQVQLPAAEQAVPLVDWIYCERFFDKMAEYGFSPRTDEERMAMLQTALQLDSIQDEQQASPYVLANQKLAEHLQGQSQSAANAPAERQQLALALAQHPELYKAALALNLAQSELDGDDEDAGSSDDAAAE
jgi:hypothetical protein